MPAKVEISSKTILFTVFFLIFLWVLVQIKEIIFWIFIAFILMSAIKPAVEYFEKLRIPRTVSILIIYIFLILSLIFIISSILPLFITQSIHLIERLPDYIRAGLPFIQFDWQLLIQQIAPLGENLVKLTLGLFNNLIALFTIFVISFYLLLERKNLDSILSGFMGEEATKKSLEIVKKVEERLGTWVRGQATLAFSIGIMTFIGLLFLGFPYLLPLALLAGVLEIVPNIGPIISAIPAVLIALTISPTTAIIVIILYFIIHQLENNLIVPIVMKKVVGLPPLVTIIAMLIGAKLAGIGGVLLAIPAVVLVETITSEYLKLGEHR
ncbi:AI-2E family transporter [Candidatus Gottesmanbacteria bacterium]|nr:AI-2E family transporter [Candidatus Gottesmanbacteria bacterium]